MTGDLFHAVVPSGAVYVGRPAPGLRGSAFANPYRVVAGDHAAAVREYVGHLRTSPELVAAARGFLAGRDLACWCPPDQPCHADVLLAIANDATARGKARSEAESETTYGMSPRVTYDAPGLSGLVPVRDAASVDESGKGHDVCGRK